MDEDKAVEGIVGGELAFADALNKTVDEDPETQAIHTIPMLDTDTYLDCGTIEGYEKALLYTLLTESEFEDANLEFIKPLVDKLWEKREEKK